MSLLDEERHSPSRTAQIAGVHVGTIFPWMMKGVRGRKLATLLVGGRRFVLRRDLEAFLFADHVPADGDDLTRRADVAGKQLDALGVHTPLASSERCQLTTATPRRTQDPLAGA